MSRRFGDILSRLDLAGSTYLLSLVLWACGGNDGAPTDGTFFLLFDGELEAHDVEYVPFMAFQVDDMVLRLEISQANDTGKLTFRPVLLFDFFLLLLWDRFLIVLWEKIFSMLQRQIFKTRVYKAYF